jgi:nitrate reductase delta subunit
MSMQITNQTLRILGALLTYPSDGLLQAIPEMQSILAKEGWLSQKAQAELVSFLDQLQQMDIYDAQEEYVGLFDRTPSLSLHLFEHVHGDSRDRGQALVDLDLLYREKDLLNATEHTPDYLPMFLEYLSLLTIDEARQALDGVIEILGAIQQRLVKRSSGYAYVFAALTSVSSSKPDKAKLQAALALDSGAELNNDQLDSAWEEQFALAALKEGDSCPKAQEMLAHIQDQLTQDGGRS